MNVLVIGRGAREHALCWKLCQSMRVTHVYCAPGNAGIQDAATCIPIDENDAEAIVAFAQAQRIGLVVIGPEQPLVSGLADRLEQAGICVFGPTAVAAQIEGSKRYAKQLMQQAGVQTAPFAVFTNYDEAITYVQDQSFPIVIKADGLASGKGVAIVQTVSEAQAVLDQMMQHKRFGASGACVVIEQCIQGEEMSLLCFVDGTTVVPMPLVQDHKRLCDDDKGPNTGGMGAYGPVTHRGEAFLERACREVIHPIVQSMEKAGIHYRGVLFAGLMVTEQDDIFVLEYNCRFGDPETQVVLMSLESDLCDVLLATASGQLASSPVPQWSTGHAVTVVLAAEGYPDNVQKGAHIYGVSDVEHSIVFHAGTKRLDDGALVVCGGRVLSVTARAHALEHARQRVYADIERIAYTGKHMRTDIGMRALI
ncbi:MAG: phosphoribosylamine--glycine ligase [Paenibacillaceae bacterium]|nr:phosphoribosylamine--glycine ligase [Paenibacillaceae bacterium]